MNPLTEDMLEAIESCNIDENDVELLKNILYQERVHKEEVWDNDAVNYVIGMIDSIDSETSVE